MSTFPNAWVAADDVLSKLVLVGIRRQIPISELDPTRHRGFPDHTDPDRCRDDLGPLAGAHRLLVIDECRDPGTGPDGLRADDL